jgi:DNA/RNA endonuclease G (NUC1)
MNSQWATTVLAMGLVATPAAVRAARDTETPAEEGIRCVARDRVPVERRFGGEKDIAARLKKGAEVTVLEIREDSARVRYPWRAGSRVGWIEARALEVCGGEFPLPLPPVPEPAPASSPVNVPRSGDSLFHPFGVPRGTVPGGRLLRKAAYDCYHDPELRYCRWVGYCFHPTGEVAPRHSGGFFADVDLSPEERAGPADYAGAYKKDMTGFDRGHLAPDATIKAFGRDAQRETYSLANITPQYSRMNQGIWRELEDRIRGWATASEPVCVETGPVFEKARAVDRLKGPNQLAIPHAYFAIVTQGSEPSVLSFIIPNEPEQRSIADVMQYAASVDAVEAAVHVDFLADLEDTLEQRIEALQPEEFWQ